MIRQIELTIASKASERSFIISLTSSFIYLPPSLQLHYNIARLLCKEKDAILSDNLAFFIVYKYKITYSVRIIEIEKRLSYFFVGYFFALFLTIDKANILS